MSSPALSPPGLRRSADVSTALGPVRKWHLTQPIRIGDPSLRHLERIWIRRRWL